MKTPRSWNATPIPRLSNQRGCPEGPQRLALVRYMHESNKELVYNAFKALDIQDNNQILELDSGSGWHLPQVLKNKKQITYTGLDSSTVMLEEAKKNNSLISQEASVQFKRYTKRILDFPSGQFDKIIAVNSIYFWQEPFKIFTQLYQLLKKGGALVLGYVERKFMEQLPFSAHGFQLYESAELLSLLERCGFSNFALRVHTHTVLSRLGTQVERDYSILKVTK